MSCFNVNDENVQGLKIQGGNNGSGNNIEENTTINNEVNFNIVLNKMNDSIGSQIQENEKNILNNVFCPV